MVLRVLRAVRISIRMGSENLLHLERKELLRRPADWLTPQVAAN